MRKRFGKRGEPYFCYDDPNMQGALGVNPHGVWKQLYRVEEGFREEIIGHGYAFDNEILPLPSDLQGEA